MKPVSPEMLLLLASRQFFAADLWTINLVSGVTLRYCSGDGDISANGFLYSSGGQIGPYWDRTDSKAKCHWAVGTSVDTLVVDCIPGQATVLGEPFLQAVRGGVFDGAEMMLERAYMPSYGDTQYGVINMFVGRVAEVFSGRSLATFNINSHLELLNLQFPRNVAQTSCLNNLGDTPCGVNLATYTQTATVTGVPTLSAFSATMAATKPAGSYDQGTIDFTSGVLDGYTATILTGAISGTTIDIVMNGPLPSLPSAGDTFNITYGCNKSLTDSNGCPKFSNQARYRGMPFTPQPSVAV